MMSISPTNRLEMMSDPQRWYSTMPDGSVRFDDPLTGNPVRTSLTPELIESEPDFNAGIAFVRARTDYITITDLYHLHEDETDLGSLDRDTFKNFILKADYHGFEQRGLSSADLREHIHDVRYILANTIFGGYPAFRQVYQAAHTNKHPMLGYETRFYHVLAQTTPHTVSFNIDLRPNNTQLEEDMLAVRALWDGMKNMDKTALVGFTMMRDSCMIGNLGLELLRREMGKPTRNLQVVTNVGSGHIDKTRREKALGLNVSAKYLQPKRIEEAGVFMDAISRIARTGMGSSDDLRLVKKLIQ